MGSVLWNSHVIGAVYPWKGLISWRKKRLPVGPAMTERAGEAAVVLKNVTKYVFHDKNGTS